MRASWFWVLCGVAPARGCRFMLYIGDEPVDARELLLESEHNLLALAPEAPRVPAPTLRPRYNATQFPLRNARTNLDGYGVSWYEAGDPFPRRVRSAEGVVDADGTPHATLGALLRGDAVPTLFRESLDSCVEESLAPPLVRLTSTCLLYTSDAADE